MDLKAVIMNPYEALVFEQFFKETGDFPVYLNFLMNAVTGRNPDYYYKQNSFIINSVALKLAQQYAIVPHVIHRGIIVHPQSVTATQRLNPNPLTSYVSFSEDLEVAKVFADLDHPFSEPIKIHLPTRNSCYLIETGYRNEELLFHWRWSELVKNLGDLFPSFKLITYEQKEVILKNTLRRYYVNPFPRGTSNHELGSKWT